MRRLALPIASALLLASGAQTTPCAAQTHVDTAIGPLEEHHLDNGMAVVIQEDHRVPAVSLALRYNEGATDPGQQAAATLTTFLMLGRTAHVPAGEYYRLLAQAGATGVSDRTQPSAAVLEATVPSNRLALPLWLWSDQMVAFDSALDDAQLALQKGKLREQRRVALEGAPLGRLDAIATQELYPATHPYHFAEFSTQDVDALDRAAVLAFHDGWITPAHATLVIVGDVTSADAERLVERYFGSIPRGVTPGCPPSRLCFATAPAVPVPAGETQVDIAANVPRAHVSIRWPTPRLLTPEDARLDVVARLVAGSRTGWLFWKLVDEKKVAVNVTARQRSDALGSQFEIDVEGAKGKTPKELLAAFDAALDEVGRREPTSKELAGAIYETVIDRVLSLELASTRAFDFARTFTLAGAADYQKHDLERYGHVDPGHVQDAITRLLPRDRRVVLLVTPTPGASLGGDRAGRRVTPAGTP